MTEALVEHLRPLRARRRALAAGDGPDPLDVLREGNARANATADRTLAEVRELMGTAY